MQAINYNIAQETANTQATATIVRKDAMQKIGLFVAILSCLILAVNI